MSDRIRGVKLNKEQKEAVQHQTGPMLVVAGAGTGKTRVIVERIHRLIKDGVQPSRILALTFTEKAATEMLDRVIEQTGSYLPDLTIMTFNAYGESLLRRYSVDIGLARNFVLIGDSAQIVFMRQHLDELELDYYSPISRPDSQLGDIRDYFSKLKQNLITPDRYIKFASKMKHSDEADVLESKKHRELARAYDKYIQLCRTNSVIDYDDHIYLLIELFKKRPNVLQKVREGYDFVMVDEFQDTNLMQSVLIDMIVDKKQNLMVVGDDDQSIYGFRGANLENILDFKTRYPDTKEVTLIKNYRSTQQILDRAYQLIQNNNPERLEAKLKINKKLKSSLSGPNPKLHEFESLNQELAWVAEDIRNSQRSKVIKTIAVLARRNAIVGAIHEQLDTADMKHVVVGQRYDLYQEPIIKMIHEALRAVTEQYNDVALFHTLNGPLFSIPGEHLTKIHAEARQEFISLEDAILASENKELTKAVAKIKDWRSLLGATSVSRLTYEILDSSGLKDSLYKSAKSDNDSAHAVIALSELFSVMRDFEKISTGSSAIQYLEALPALQAAGESLEDDTLALDDTNVSVLTVHKAKGLEWDKVYIIDCSEKSFPLAQTQRGIDPPIGLIENLSSASHDHAAEERRLMYVAMTRAKRELVFTYSKMHHSQAQRRPSRFLKEAELLGAQIHDQQALENVGLNQFAVASKSDVGLPNNMISGNDLLLTVSQIEDYQQCPLNFYYKYILKVPEEANPARDYGLILHQAVEDINRSLMSGEIIEISELEKRVLGEWPKAGYISKKQRDRAIQQALKTLRSVYKKAREEQLRPISVELPFSAKIKNQEVVIRGKFDAIFESDDGIEIRDYKTSTTVTTPEAAKRRATSSEQLTLYALAWQSLHGDLPALVTLDFLDTGLQASVRKTQKGLDGALLRLERVVKGIKAKDFSPGSRHDFCLHPDI